MAPKVEAACAFVEATGGKAQVWALPRVSKTPLLASLGDQKIGLHLGLPFDLDFTVILAFEG